ncbi:CCA tRNA nucleotidyltransferase [Paracerasibacillus soli]|uniref:CCA-adding enzyme n=1 Tax=Paracerasibacillus soli TaxID=480284 RepID=A0ABU5CPM4_9BACI|nr:CCA tRNA nucleotidyltransferase [Virgibacillus soli]MDY0408306.1 CCA tRNA nucleotidyltransferase [Virgibacillus soli]
MKMDESFHRAFEVLQIIEEHGFSAYLVGGCVRDYVLQRDVGDIDIATSATPKQIQTIFEKVIPVGIEHGTVIVRHRQNSYEVTTFRIDGDYSDQRHPDSVRFIDKIDLDLARRDFTINALAMDREKNIIDLFSGKEDLKKKTIRTVGDSLSRFNEDALRMIRALRFSSQLGFTIEVNTLQAIQQLKAEIEQVAIERILHEMTKFFAGKHICIGLRYLYATQIYQFLPVFKDNLTLIKKIPENILPLSSFSEVIALLHLVHPNISILEWVKKWKCANVIKKEATHLVDNVLYYRAHDLDPWLVYQVKQDYHKQFFRLVKILFGEIDQTTFLSLYHDLAIHSRKELQLNGNDLLDMFPQSKPGPWVQEILNTVEKLVVLRQIKNDKTMIKEWILCNPQK